MLVKFPEIERAEYKARCEGEDRPSQTHLHAGGLPDGQAVVVSLQQVEVVTHPHKQVLAFGMFLHHMQTDRQIDRQVDRQGDGQEDRQGNRQAGRKTGRQ